MSRENVEIARAIRESLLTGGPEAAARFFHPDVTFDVAVGHYEGIEGMTRWFETIVEYLIDYEIVDAEFIDAGDGVVVNNVMKARGGHTALATQDQIYLMLFEDGRVISVSRYPSKAEALAAANGSG
jgi:SnoaL-like protein